MCLIVLQKILSVSMEIRQAARSVKLATLVKAALANETALLNPAHTLMVINVLLVSRLTIARRPHATMAIRRRARYATPITKKPRMAVASCIARLESTARRASLVTAHALPLAIVSTSFVQLKTRTRANAHNVLRDTFLFKEQQHARNLTVMFSVMPINFAA